MQWKANTLVCLLISGSACSSLCKIASIVSPNGIDSLTKECMASATNCSGLPSGNVEFETQVRYVHKMMLACDCFEYIFKTPATFGEIC